MTPVINNIYEAGVCPKDFIQVTIIALKGKTKATKCSGNLTISLIAHTAKTIARTLRRKMKRKIQDVIGDPCGYRRGQGTRDGWNWDAENIRTNL